ncbi:MAG TPA: site-2 protease family protein [Candidatus Angelobacter sp.]|jgi:Zn-dependent protease
MCGHRITLFNLFGFNVTADASWLFLAVLLTSPLVTRDFPFLYRGLSTNEYWWLGGISILVLLASMMAHVLAHFLIARHQGLRMKGVALCIFGGVSEMEDEPPNPGSDCQVAIAGLLANTVIGSFFYFLYRAEKITLPPAMTGILAYTSAINWVLAGLNLIPAFPLDGGRLLRSALWCWKQNRPIATGMTYWMGSGCGGIFMLLALWEFVAGNFVEAMWWFLTGLFLREFTQSAYQHLLMRTVLKGKSVRCFMKLNPITVPSAISLQELVDGYFCPYHCNMFPVISGSQRLAGYVTTAQLKNVPREQWSRHSVQAILQPWSLGNTVEPESDAVDALSKMSTLGLSGLLVVDGNDLAGVIALKDLVYFLAIVLDMEGDVRLSLPDSVCR